MATRRHGLFSKARPSYYHAKQSCYIYGSSDDGVDTGVHIEGEGVLFISQLAVREMAEVLGFSFFEEGQKIEEENAHLQRENEVLREAVKLLEDDLASFGRALARSRKDQ